MYWRVVDTEALDAYSNMAIDEAVAVAVRTAKAPPTLRFYLWKSFSVSIGQFQRLEEIDTLFCRKENIPVVRRPTGGRAILHGTDLTYSFSAPNIPPFFSEGLLSTYSHLSRAFYFAFRSLGFDVKISSRRERGRVLTGSPLCFQSVSYGEITISGRKVMGSAQKRWKEGFLQQGSIMLTVEGALMRSVFRQTEKDNIAQTMIGLSNVNPSVDLEDLKKAIVNAFQEVFGVSFIRDSLSRYEEDLAERLRTEKYLSPEWTEKR
jgi:lipoate-protein ligase A